MESKILQIKVVIHHSPKKHCAILIISTGAKAFLPGVDDIHSFMKVIP